MSLNGRIKAICHLKYYGSKRGSRAVKWDSKRKEKGFNNLMCLCVMNESQFKPSLKTDFFPSSFVTMYRITNSLHEFWQLDSIQYYKLHVCNQGRCYKGNSCQLILETLGFNYAFRCIAFKSHLAFHHNESTKASLATQLVGSHWLFMFGKVFNSFNQCRWYTWIIKSMRTTRIVLKLSTAAITARIVLFKRPTC